MPEEESSLNIIEESTDNAVVESEELLQPLVQFSHNGGFYEEGTNRLINIFGCRLLDKRINELVQLFNKLDYFYNKDYKENTFIINNLQNTNFNVQS